MPNLIDPHKAFGSANIPDLSQMTIRAELFVYRRGRTVINKKYNDIETITNSGKNVSVNLLGYDQKTKTFTTKWSSNEENFGITNINIRINASYVPEVDVDFIDVRAQSLLGNPQGSDYSILYEFPPPIFKLVVKGFYGMTTEYYLHLVSQNTKFNTSTGNFEIKGKFIGLTFAPLADIKFGYLKYIPYILNDTNSVKIDNGVTNTAELLVAIKELQVNLKKFVEQDYSKFNEKRDKIGEIDKLIDNLKIVNVVAEIKKIFDRYDKDKTIASNSSKVFINLPISYVDNKIDHDVYNDVKIYVDSILRELDVYGITHGELKPIEKESNINTNISNKIKNAPQTPQRTYLYVLDLTNINERLTNKRNEIKVNVEEDAKKLQNRIVDTTIKKLNFKPTIRQVFDILCKDADDFIKELQNTSHKAQEESVNRIVGAADTNKFSWPDYIKEQPLNNGKNSVKSIPDDRTWEEVKFVDRFINAQILAEKNIKDASVGLFEKDGDGNYKWFPLNPHDSPIYTQSHPYFSNGDTPTKIYETLLQRALLLINDTYKSITDEEFFNTYAKAEALNIVTGIGGFTKTLEALKIDSTSNFNILDIDNPLINSILKNNFNVSSLVFNADTSYDFSNELIDIKSQTDFEFIDTFNNEPGGVPKLRNEGVTTNKVSEAIEKFIKDEYESNILVKFFNRKRDFDLNLSQYNISFIQDEKFNDTENLGQSDLYFGSLKNQYILQNKGTATSNYSSQTINDIIKNPEVFLLFTTKRFRGEVVQSEVVNAPIKIPKLNEEERFKSPGVTEIPKINLIYYGYKCHLVDATDSNGIFINKNYVGNLAGKPINAYLKFNGKIYQENVNIGNNIQNALIFLGDGDPNYPQYNVFSKDEFDYIKALPQESRDKFKKYYEDYYNEFNTIKNLIASDVINISDNKYFNENGRSTDKYYNDIWSKFYEKHYIIIGSDTINNTNKNFNDVSRRNLVVNFINNTIRNLSPYIDDKKEENNKEKKSALSKLNDDDIRTEMYYAFKSFNDRWFTDFTMFDGEPLIDKFLFVDRGMNDIGDDVVLDMSPLLNENLDSSLYTTIINLLVKNGFEFFPMQNFLNFEDGKYRWTDDNVERIFGTHVNEVIIGKPRFICMYVGGTSSKLNITPSDNEEPNYKDDGVDLTPNSPSIPSELNNDRVNAFLVNFGTGNQSFFKSLSLDQSEFKETNESINILDKIANAGAEPTPVGQSLFNTYEQRSYTCGVECVGNMMIQPTMYFQLNNVPLFKGAYLILEVNHSISAPNLMTTNFKGVRIPKATKPIRTEIATVSGFDLSIPDSNINLTDSVLNPVEINSKGQKIDVMAVIDSNIIETFVNPVNSGVITSEVNKVRKNLGQTKAHGGIDIGISVGTQIFSTYSGKIIRFNNQIDGYGNYFIIDHGQLSDNNYYYSLYAHLSKVFKQEGDLVKIGELIGESGGAKGDTGSGSSTGPHLHFEIKRSARPIDGYSYFGNPNVVVLNPTTFLKGEFQSNPSYAASLGQNHAPLNVTP